MIKILKTSETSASELFSRTIQSKDVSEVVGKIIDDVKANGDKALFAYT